MRRLEQVWHRALVHYFVASETFNGAYGKLQQAAADLYPQMEILYGKKGHLVQLARKGLASHRRVDADIRDSMLERMGDVSAFMKEFKQRLSRWYNCGLARCGPNGSRACWWRINGERSKCWRLTLT